MPPSMLAVAIPHIGGPELLQVEELPVPEPGPGEVLVQVAYAGVNFAEVLFRRGDLGPLPSSPFVPGLEVSGRVAAVGSGVDPEIVGDPVMAWTLTGGYAQYAVADAATTWPIAELSMRTAGAFACIAPTAWALLSEVGRVRAGDTVLIHAAAGGIGTLAGQLARHLGARAIYGVASSPEKAAYAEPFGYDEVFVGDEYSERLRKATHGRGVDVILDSVGGPHSVAALDLLAPMGRVVCFGNASGAPPVARTNVELWHATRSTLGFSIGTLAAEDPAALTRIAMQIRDLLVAGHARIDLISEHSLGDAADIHRALEARTTTGKAVLAIDPGLAT